MTAGEPMDKSPQRNSVDMTARENGARLVKALYAALRTARMYGFDHPTVRRTAADLVATLLPFQGDGEASLEVRDLSLLINDARIRVSTGGLEMVHHLASTLAELGVGRIRFARGLEEHETIAFVDAIHQSPVAHDDPLSALRDLLHDRHVASILVEPPPPTYIALPAPRLGDRAIEAYYRTISVLREIHGNVRTGAPVRLRLAKRAVHGVIDVVGEDQSAVLALASVKRIADYRLTHAANTSVLSVVIGSNLGLTRKALGELGVAALFADLGMMRIDDDILEAPRKLTANEMAQVREHPITAARSFMKAPRMADVALRCVRTTFEHHRGFDGSGYPRLENNRPNSLFANIVAICDRYDALTSPRSYRTRPVAPPRALSMMLAEAGTTFDPALVKVFVNTIGLYPTGSIVQLDTEEVGTVHRTSEDPGLLDRPQVRLFATPNGNYTNRVVDLAERGGDGGFIRSVIRTLEPEEIDLAVSEQLAVI